MRLRQAGLVLLLVLAACRPPADPRVRAAEDFRDTAFALIARDDEQTKKLNALRLGMSDEEVIALAGPPNQRETRDTASGTKREIWIYNGELKQLGTLTLEGRKLVQVVTQ